ncbi:NUDIX domain-containing protein [Sulfurospirillum arcachonense]|uniref:NUDIX domain-containing protein n=1 Tax=Sulfurospirillum arcachonense TaxID=57666 RepID=UPI00046A7CC0|nr:NUDIX domain-containing protein [Sulfurospirillum arcachonense]
MKNKIKFLNLQTCTNSAFIKPQSMFYMQNGVEKRWDIVDTHDSVAILLYHKDLDSFVFVKQFRPSIYLKNDDGFTYELCAGLVDKKKTLQEIAYEEILEETGYDVPLDEVKKITSFYTAVGFAGGRQTLYFAIIDNSMKVSEGGGVDNEAIEVIYLKKDEAIEFMFDEGIATTSGLMFALMWYFKTNQ